MAEHVSDVRDGEIAGETSGESVAERVGSVRDAIGKLDIDLSQAACDDSGEGVRGSEGRKGGSRGKEDLRVRRGVRSPDVEVSEEAVADFGGEILGYGFAVLDGSKIYLAVNPIDVVKTEQSDLDASYAIGREQENDSEVA